MKYSLRIWPNTTRIYDIGCRLSTDSVKTAVKIHRLMNKDRISWNLSSDIFLQLYKLHGVIYKDGVYV